MERLPSRAPRVTEYRVLGQLGRNSVIQLISLISSQLTTTKMLNRLDSAGCSCSNLSQLDDSYTSTEDWQEDVGTTLDLELQDGRINSVVSRALVTVSPLDQGLRENFTVRLATNHYSFTLGRSVTIRAFTAFLYLEVRLDTH